MTRRATTRPQKPKLDVRIKFRDDGSVEVDPHYNELFIRHLDALYVAALRDEFDETWSDDHKVAFFIADMMDGILAQWESPETPDSRDGEAPVPHINESPVRDVFDIKDMDPAKSRKMN